MILLYIPNLILLSIKEGFANSSNYKFKIKCKEISRSLKLSISSYILMVVNQNWQIIITVQSVDYKSMFKTPGANVMLKRPNDQAIKLYKVCSLKPDEVW